MAQQSTPTGPTAAACARRAFRGTRVVARRNAPSTSSSSTTPSRQARPFRLARVPRPGMTNTDVQGAHREAAQGRGRSRRRDASRLHHEVAGLGAEGVLGVAGALHRPVLAAGRADAGRTPLEVWRRAARSQIHGGESWLSYPTTTLVGGAGARRQSTPGARPELLQFRCRGSILTCFGGQGTARAGHVLPRPWWRQRRGRQLLREPPLQVLPPRCPPRLRYSRPSRRSRLSRRFPHDVPTNSLTTRRSCGGRHQTDTWALLPENAVRTQTREVSTGLTKDSGPRPQCDHAMDCPGLASRPPDLEDDPTGWELRHATPIAGRSNRRNERPHVGAAATAPECSCKRASHPRRSHDT